MDENRDGLAKYRLEKAKRNLEAAKLLLENNFFSESIGRSYYCILHAAKALLAYDKFDSKKHSEIIAYFNRYYIKTSELEKEFSKIISKAFKIRNDSDYQDFYVVAKEDAKDQLEKASRFFNRIKDYIDKNKKPEL